MTRKINSFHGSHSFLSNFFPCSITVDNQEFPSLEHAFQASKTTIPAERELIRQAPTPGKAKRVGRKITLRSDWNDVKLDIMENLLRQKFSVPKLANLLKGTDDAELIEGNTWGDRYWGVCDGEGENHLGKLLMKVRDDL